MTEHAAAEHPSAGDGAAQTAAVIGAGVSGLTAAYLLQRTHRVTLFESEPRLGGHAHTHDVDLADGSQVAVDSGFIVLNDRTYPLLRRLFGELDVATRPTEMSMSISCAGCGLGYVGGRGAAGIFAQRRRALDPRFWRLLAQVRRFQRRALAMLDDPDESVTYREFLADFDDHFVDHYALPVVSCVWSMGHEQALDYPAAYLFAFLRHHGFLALRDAPTWHTVLGGSRAYVEVLSTQLDVVRSGTRVHALSRKPDAVELDLRTGPAGAAEAPSGNEHAAFDKVVVATHADEALRLLTDANETEREVLGSFGYSTNPAYLHRDASVLPARRRERASWNYRLDDCGSRPDRARVSYWMNRLQGHPESDPLVVTLNADQRPRDVVAEMSYDHPTYTRASVAAQRRLPELNSDRVAFAGSYHGWGFHEDGCRSGVAAAQALGGGW